MKQARLNRGVVLIYMIIAMIAFIAFVSLGVDLARAQKAKTELQIAADAASRNAAGQLYSSTTDSTAIRNNVRTAGKNTASANYADGTAVSLANSDIELGLWVSPTFTPVTGSAMLTANAVRITASRTSAKGNALSLAFGGIFGRKTIDIVATGTAIQVAAINLNQNVQSTGNPFLAGMPAGSKASLNNPHNNPDTAGTSAVPLQSPDQANMVITPGSNLNFASISGSAGNDPNGSNYTPDGDTSNTGHNTNGSENGISDITAPINALVGVFLDDNAPNTTAAPASLDFSTQSARDFTTISPQLKQTFFIGDGKNSSGATQQFVVPPGATRLFIVNWDYYEWNNNFGYRNIQVIQPKFISIVK